VVRRIIAPLYRVAKAIGIIVTIDGPFASFTDHHAHQSPPNPKCRLDDFDHLHFGIDVAADLVECPRPSNRVAIFPKSRFANFVL
jgi:hypothetical protein